MPPPSQGSRDDAVRLLQQTMVMAMGQDSLDDLHPTFQDQIAACVDAIIRAAKPGGGPPAADQDAVGFSVATVPPSQEDSEMQLFEDPTKEV